MKTLLEYRKIPLIAGIAFFVFTFATKAQNKPELPRNTLPTNAQPIVSLSSGDWNDPVVWSCHCVPTQIDDVLIKTGHTIRITPAMGAQKCKNLTVETGGIFEATGVFLADPKAMISAHLILCNPAYIATDSTNYLMIKPQYALSYNNTRHHANWVSWELTDSWLGLAERQDDFRPDSSLPTDWYKTVPGDYTNSGFDRGHLCPSADRTNTKEDNSSTFLMTNIIPQAPDLNREGWAYLEEYCRSIVKTGYKASVIAGTIGTGGAGSNGFATFVKNQVNVPARVYKIIVFYPESGSVNTNSTVIAVNFPNTNSDTKATSWLKYITTPAEIETLSQTSLFCSLPAATQNALKNQKYDILKSPFEVDAPVSTYNNKPLYIGPRGGCYYINSNGNKTYVDRSYCSPE
jgi:endonuclease G